MLLVTGNYITSNMWIVHAALGIKRCQDGGKNHNAAIIKFSLYDASIDYYNVQSKVKVRHQENAINEGGNS